MTAILSPALIFQGVGFAGLPLPGGKLYSYIAGTSTPQATYTDSTEGTPNTNPVILNANGQAAVWLDPTKTYKFTLTDSFGNLIYTTDQVQGSLTAAALATMLATILTQAYLGAILYPQTPAESAASVVPTNYQYPPFDIRRYGADSTGATASDAAMVSAIAVCGTTGGVIRLPAGSYLFNNQIVWTNKLSITLQGDAGETSGAAPATNITYSNAGSTAFITAGNSTGCGLRNLAIALGSNAFSGNVIQLGSNAALFSIFDCEIGNVAAISCTHLNLDASIEGFFARINFLGGSTSVKGQLSTGGSFSNVMTFRDCQWVGSTSNPVAYCGESWTFDGCTFEGVTSGASVLAGAIGTLSSTPVKALSIRGCWFGDVTAAGGIWLTLFGNGISIIGNRFGGFATSTYAVSLNATNGVDIRANTFDTFSNGISFDSATISAVSIQNNFFTNVTNPLSGANAPLALRFNPNQPAITPPSGLGSFAANGYEVSENGIIRQWGTATVTAGTPLAISFPKTFPNALFAVNVSLATVAGGATSAYTSASSASQFTANVNGAGAMNVFWQAVGN